MIDAMHALIVRMVLRVFMTASDSRLINRNQKETAMGIGSKILQGATKVAGKALPALGVAQVIAGALPLIRDMFSSPTVDQDKIAKIKAMRDSAASQMSGELGISYDKALEMVDREFQPMIEEASQPQGGADGATIAEDAAGLGLDAVAGAGMIGSRFLKGGTKVADAVKDSSGVLAADAKSARDGIGARAMTQGAEGRPRPGALRGLQDGPAGSGGDPYAPPGSGRETPGMGPGMPMGDSPMSGDRMPAFPSAENPYAPPGSGRGMPMSDSMPMGDGPGNQDLEAQVAMQQMGSMGMPSGYGGGTPEMQAIEALAQEHADQMPSRPMPTPGLPGGPSRGPFAHDAIQAWQDRPAPRSQFPGEWQADPWARKPPGKPAWDRT